jgi:hypothetical protein
MCTNGLGLNASTIIKSQGVLCFPVRFKQLGFMYGGFDEVRDSSWCLQSGINVVGSMEIDVCFRVFKWEGCCRMEIERHYHHHHRPLSLFVDWD